MTLLRFLCKSCTKYQVEFKRSLKIDGKQVHLIVLPSGQKLVSARSIRRVVPSKRWGKAKINAIQVNPWEPEIKAVNPLEPVFRRRYITWNLVQQYGPSPGCKACCGLGGAHTEECRERFRQAINKEESKATARAAKAVGLTPADRELEPGGASEAQPTTSLSSNVAAGSAGATSSSTIAVPTRILCLFQVRV